MNENNKAKPLVTKETCYRRGWMDRRLDVFMQR